MWIIILFQFFFDIFLCAKDAKKAVKTRDDYFARRLQEIQDMPDDMPAHRAQRQCNRNRYASR